MDILAYVLLQRVFKNTHIVRHYNMLSAIDPDKLSDIANSQMKSLDYWGEEVPNTRTVRVYTPISTHDPLQLSALASSAIYTLDYTEHEEEVGPSKLPILALLGIFSPVST